MIGYIVQWENLNTDECPDIDDGSTCFVDSISSALAFYERMAANRHLDVKLWMAEDLKSAKSSEVFDAEVRATTKRGDHGWHLDRFTDRRQAEDIDLYSTASWPTLMMLVGDILSAQRRGGNMTRSQIIAELHRGKARDPFVVVDRRG